MATEREYQVALAHLEQDLDGFVGASFVEVETGKTLAAHSVRPEFDLTSVGAFSSEMVKQQYRTMKSLNLDGELEEMFVTLSGQMHLCHMITPNVFLYLAADRDETNLAMMKVAARLRAEALRADSETEGQVA